MKKILIIGIGAGHLDYVTIQAVKAMNEVDVFFLPDKGSNKAQLANIRRDICARYATQKPYRMVDFEVPERDRHPSKYDAEVTSWRQSIEMIYERLLNDELEDGRCGGFLVWGDPSLYDGTIDIVEHIRAKDGYDIEYEVIPGITSIQALAARHRIALNRIGDSIHITTGRRVADDVSNNADNLVVMLDAQQSFRQADQDLDIYWGAYIGTEDEILVAGKLADVRDEIMRLRAEARARKGWIMDTYLMRKSGV